MLMAVKTSRCIRPYKLTYVITGFWSKERSKSSKAQGFFFLLQNFPLEKSISMIKNEQYKHSPTSHSVQDWATPFPSLPPCRINRKYLPNSNASSQSVTIQPCTQAVSHRKLRQASTNPLRTIHYILKHVSQGPWFIYRDKVPVQKNLDVVQQLEKSVLAYDTDGLVSRSHRLSTDCEVFYKLVTAK